MTKQDKRKPTFEDTDLMPFGKYKNQLLQDIPASYLRWLQDALFKEGFSINPKPEIFDKEPKWKQEKYMLFNYIYNCSDALQLELGEKE